ncbi:MAG: ATP-binding protein [Desulfobacteraceae bacterium]|nr:ATP-binding protein [Desulfobacteraceae bacterium]
MLLFMKLNGTGPARELHFEPAERVNLLTGDNGLSKTFLLECAWWALSGNWTGTPAYPRQDAKKDEPEIIFQVADEDGYENSSYNWETQEWSLPKGRRQSQSLLIYARADGDFAIFDPVKDYGKSSFNPEGKNSLILKREDVWNGISTGAGTSTKFLINGLINDWVNWQNSPGMYPFETLKKVLKRLSPPNLGDLGLLEPGRPVRIPSDSRWIPTIKHPYGEIPLVYASASVRRIVALAYLIVWTWEEHKTQSELIRKEPNKKMVILADEIEAHLHPQWQRTILPALTDIRDELKSELQVQFFVATHSPLIMASMEPKFDADKDKIFHFDMVIRWGNNT